MSQTFICTFFFHFRFEVPLRPYMWSSHAVAGVSGSSVQMPPGPSVLRKSNVSHDPTGHLMEDCHARDRKKAARPAVDGVHRKKLRSNPRYSKENNKAPDNSRQLTDYFSTREGAEVLTQQLS